VNYAKILQIKKKAKYQYDKPFKIYNVTIDLTTVFGMGQ
jgi:hypothetical protein